MEHYIKNDYQIYTISRVPSNWCYDVQPKTRWQRLLWRLLQRTGAVFEGWQEIAERFSPYTTAGALTPFDDIVEQLNAYHSKYGRHPEKCYIGIAEHQELAASLNKYHAVAICTKGDLSVYGMECELIPHMKGILLV